MLELHNYEVIHISCTALEVRPSAALTHITLLSQKERPTAITSLSINGRLRSTGSAPFSGMG